MATTESFCESLRSHRTTRSQATKSKKPAGVGRQPTFVIQGCCYHQSGPVVPRGESTAYRNIQIYILDEQHEHEPTAVRIGNVDFRGETINAAEKATLERVWRMRRRRVRRGVLWYTASSR